jgi:DMSO/TMAO reductase YedYZ molybdopterin-dependent catalytic subunit
MFRKLLTILFVVLLAAMSACQPAPTATAAPTTVPTPVPPTATPEPPAEPILDLVAADGTAQSLTLADLQALPVTEGLAGIKSSTGKITLPTAFKGVSLKDLAAQFDTFDETMGLSIEASDGYSITFSYDQVMNSTFIQYDPGTGDELKSPLPATAMLAYEMDGQPLNKDMDGVLRLVVVSDEARQVVDGHWSVKFVTKVEVKLLAADWNLSLEGAINELMDRATFESGASPNCHGLTWTDDKAQVWVGIPLWLLIGRVDDAVKHQGPAFNDAVAAAGYTVDVIAADGYTVTFESARIARNDNILVAYMVDDNPLPEKYFPLRLVGSDLQKNEMVGQVIQIVVHVEPVAEVEPTPAGGDPATAQLVVSGLVDNLLALNEADLRGLEVVQITAVHPKKGEQTYEGVRLSTLLEMAGVQAGANKLVFTASDGFVSEVFLAEVQACPDCLLAFTDTEGAFNLAMPGLPSNVWAKAVVTIELK